MSQPKRLAVLITHPIQYFRPVFAELAQQPDVELRVFFGCDHDRLEEGKRDGARPRRPRDYFFAPKSASRGR